MAKFKVGDKVKQTNGPGKGATGKIVNIYPLRPDMVASMGFGEYVGHDLITFMGPEGKSIVPEDWLVAANSRACNSRNPIVAKAMNACGTAKNAVTITLDSRKRDGWVTGKVNGYDFEAKVFDEGSVFGIKSGRVSKLWMRKGDETVNYDRGWDERPKSAEAKAAYTELLRKMESLPKVMNACGTARNADINAELGRDVDRLDGRVKEELKKQAESYAYWLEADCGREINYLLKVADENKDVQPSIVAELKRLRKRVDDAIAASKRLPR